MIPSAAKLPSSHAHPGVSLDGIQQGHETQPSTSAAGGWWLWAEPLCPPLCSPAFHPTSLFRTRREPALGVKTGRRRYETGPRDPRDPARTVWPGRTAVSELSAVGTTLPAGPGKLWGTGSPRKRPGSKEVSSKNSSRKVAASVWTVPLCTPPPGGSQDKRSAPHRKHHPISPPGPLLLADEDRVFSAGVVLYSETGRVHKGPGNVGWDRDEACGGQGPPP